MESQIIVPSILNAASFGCHSGWQFQLPRNLQNPMTVKTHRKGGSQFYETTFTRIGSFTEVVHSTLSKVDRYELHLGNNVQMYVEIHFDSMEKMRLSTTYRLPSGRLEITQMSAPLLGNPFDREILDDDTPYVVRWNLSDNCRGQTNVLARPGQVPIWVGSPPAIVSDLFTVHREREAFFPLHLEGIEHVLSKLDLK